MNIDKLLEKNFVKDLIHQTCGEEREVISRPACFVVRGKSESSDKVERLIILPPMGYTANSTTQTNSHDEADSATIEIFGAVRDDKNGFSKLKDCLMVPSYYEDGSVSELNKPYLTYDLSIDNGPHFSNEVYSAGEPPFHVVKNDGFGFYHNLINTKDDWLVLKLVKKLRPAKNVDLTPIIASMPANEAIKINKLYAAVIEFGDDIFSEVPTLIGDICNIDLSKVMPALFEMLYVYDTGKHEACSVFAIILKLGKKYPDAVTIYIEDGLRTENLPKYYGLQLIDKIEKSRYKELAISKAA